MWTEGGIPPLQGEGLLDHQLCSFLVMQQICAQIAVAKQ